MKKLLLSIVAFALLLATPTFAQFFPDLYPPPPPYGYDEPPPRYYDRYREPPPRYYDRRRGPPDDYYERRSSPRDYEMQRRPSARFCVTSRGNCPTEGYLRPGDPCSCFIPGFGPKRGNVR